MKYYQIGIKSIIINNFSKEVNIIFENYGINSIKELPYGNYEVILSDEHMEYIAFKELAGREYNHKKMQLGKNE